MKPLRLGVIGVGYLGQHHARLYAGLPGAKLVGIVDADRQRAKQIAEKHGTAVYDDVAVLLGQVDAVSIAVPTSAHHAVAKQCLEAGVHALVEKPIAVTLAEAQELVQVARAHQVILQVGHIERFNPIMQQVRPYVKRPLFIECQRVSPFTGRGADVDVVLDMMIHDLDMVLSFRPGSVEEIRAAGAPIVSATNDVAQAQITFNSGCVANVMASRMAQTRIRTLRVIQQDVYISVDYQTRQAAICRRSPQADGQAEIPLEQLHGTDEEPLKLELESFLHAIRTNTPPLVSGEDGVAALQLADHVLASIGGFLRRQATA